MTSIMFLVDTLFGLYLMVVLLRLWLQFVRADFYNPFSQFIVKATHPLVGPMRRVIPSMGRLDTATLILALLVAGLKIFTVALVGGMLYTDLLGLLIGAVFTVLREGFQLIMWVLIIRAILSWVSQGQNPIEFVLHQLTEPVLAPIRRIIPPMGGLDLSVMIAILLLIFIQKLLADLLGIF